MVVIILFIPNIGDVHISFCPISLLWGLPILLIISQRTSFGFLTLLSCLFSAPVFIIYLPALSSGGAWVLCCCTRLCPVVVSRGYSLKPGAQASYCGGFSYGGEWALWHKPAAVGHGA